MAFRLYLDLQIQYSLDMAINLTAIPMNKLHHIFEIAKKN